jgi:multiple sugar transport system permease protein
MDARLAMKKMWLFIIAACAALAVSFPVIWMLLNAVKSSDQIVSQPYSILPERINLEGFRAIWRTTDFSVYLRNSLIVAFCVAVFATISAFLAAYSLSRIRLRLNSALTNATLWSYMLSPIMLVLPAYVVLSHVGLVDTLAGLVLVQMPMAFALSFWIVYPFMRDVSTDLEDMAVLDGAGVSRAIWHILLPLLRPAIFAALIFSFLFSWNEYITARVIVSGSLKTLPVGLQDLYESTIVNWAVLMAGSFICIIPVFLFSLGVQRLLVDEWGVGGVKG